MTYELLEEANELHEGIKHCDSLLSLFTTRLTPDDDYHRVILQRVNDPYDYIPLATDALSVSEELARIMYNAVYAEKEKLIKKFAELGENS